MKSNYKERLDSLVSEAITAMKDALGKVPGNAVTLSGNTTMYICTPDTSDYMYDFEAKTIRLVRGMLVIATDVTEDELAELLEWPEPDRIWVHGWDFIASYEGLLDVIDEALPIIGETLRLSEENA